MENFAFDKTKDLYPVDQFGFVDLRSAYVSGVVSGAAPASADVFNEASPDAMMNRPDDFFSRDRQRQYVTGTLKAQAAAEAAASAE